MTNFRIRQVEQKKRRKSKLDIKWSKNVLNKSKLCQKVVKKLSKSCNFCCSIFEKDWKMEEAEEKNLSIKGQRLKAKG
jgi:hypothetical protein